MITTLGEEEAGLCASRSCVCLFRTRQFLSFFSSSWYQGLAAASDCGTPWSFLLFFFVCRRSNGPTEKSSKRPQLVKIFDA